VKSLWLKRTGLDKVLAVYQGWSRSASDLAGFALPPDGDAVVFFDYAQLPDGVPEELSCYRQITVLAWSLGVWAAAHTLAACRTKIAAALAVNGTLEPMSKEYGIAPEIFLGTAANWLVPAVRRKFEFRMNLPADCGTERTAEDQQRELSALADAIRKFPAPENIFTRAAVGARDRIFPAAAQLAAWRKVGVEPEVKTELGHWIWRERWNL